jgi:antitoxin component YwqK of YwqJK toxin-antitoxin module
MKTIMLLMISALFMLGSCNQKKIFEYEGREYWSEFHAGNNVTLQQEYKVYSEGSDTLFYFTNYYTNGKLKSKVVMKNDLLWEVSFVLDSLGRKKSFGYLKNGNGFVTEFTDDDGQPASQGKYVNGNKEGWWKIYHYTGTIMDSTFYTEGFPKYEESNNALNELLDISEPIKNNLYK